MNPTLAARSAAMRSGAGAEAARTAMPSQQPRSMPMPAATDQAPLRGLESLGNAARAQFGARAPQAAAGVVPTNSGAAAPGPVQHQPAVADAPATAAGSQIGGSGTIKTDKITIEGLLEAWGTNNPMYDLSGNGKVGVPDLLLLLGKMTK